MPLGSWLWPQRWLGSFTSCLRPLVSSLAVKVGKRQAGKVTYQEYEPLAVVSDGETDTEMGKTRTTEPEKHLLHAPPLLLCIIIAMWLLVLLRCETMTWQRLVACLPGCILGTYLVFGFEWKHETEQSWTWKQWRDRNLHLILIPMMAMPHFLWLMALPFFVIPWYLVVVQAISAILEAFGLVACLGGLSVSWISGLCMFTITGQLALFALPGCLWVMFFGGVVISYDDSPPLFSSLGMIAVMAWCFALPLLHASGLWWLFLLLELMAFLAFLVFAIPIAEHQNLLWIRPSEMMVLVGLATLPGFLAALAMWTSGGWSWASWPSVFCDLWPLDVCLVPFTLFGIWCMLEVCLQRRKRTRPQVITRINILLVLVCLPLFLQIDVAKLQSRVPTLDLMPTDYVSFNVSLNKFDVHVRHSMPQFVQMPRPLWPDAEELVQSRPNRFSFWTSYMFSKYLLALAMSVLVLSSLSCPMEGTEPQALADSQRDLLTTLVVIAQLAICTKLSLTASWFGQLTASGLDFEGYDTCLTAGLLWFVAQAFSLRILNLQTCYNPMDVALNSLSLLPFLGDPFDSLKDTMLAAVALTSRVWWVKILGGGALLYLWALHLCLLLPNKANRLELQQSYLPILSLKAPGKAKGHSKWVQILTVLYKQSTPARRWAMLLEDVPQGLLACAVSVADGFKPYILMVNIALPAARLIFAWAFHHRISWELKEWMLQEALDAVAEGKAQLSDEFTAALLRLQGQYEENLWEDVDEERWIWAKEQVKPLIAEGKNDLFQNFTVLPWMLLQLFNRDEDADGLSWDLVTVWPSMLSIIVEDSNAMKALLKLWTHRTFRIEARDSGVGDAGCRALATGISQMQHLTQLELILESKILQSNKIGQVGCESLAEGISKLRQITKLSLNLEWNEIGDHGCTSLADKISNMELIIDLKLELAGNKIGQVGCESLAEGISILRQITKLSLNLGWNEIGDHGCTSLADKISNMELITDLELELAGNKISQVGCESLAGGISKLRQITKLSLNLYMSEIGAHGCTSLADKISNMELITDLKLVLSDNKIDQVGCESLAGGISKLRQITKLSLNLEWNEIGAHGCTSLADKISNLELITDLELVLTDNKIGQVGCESLAGGISKLRQITKLSLNLERNEIGAHGCTSLADKISNMELITDLKLLLDDNKIGQVGCESLAEGISKLWQIANLFLDLSENEIGGDGCATLANCISKLKFITQLRLALYDNNIGKDGFRALADGLCQLQGVTHLRLEFGLEENEAAKIKSLFKAQSPSAKIYVY